MRWRAPTAGHASAHTTPIQDRNPRRENRAEAEKRGERLLDDGVTGQLKQDRT